MNGAIIRAPARQRPLKYDGTGRSFIVRSPGRDDSTFGMELTTIDAVAISPGTPPGIRRVRFGTP